MENINLLRKFFKSFMKGDVDAMLECYHHDIVFTDPLFGKLEREEVKNMWHMLFQYGKRNFQISYKDLVADKSMGTAKWRAVYVFGREKREVINLIESSFKFQDSKIIEQIDSYDIWLWASQALGWKGWLLGWSNYFQLKIQQKTRNRLLSYRPNK